MFIPHRAFKRLWEAETGASDQAGRPWLGAQSSQCDFSDPITWAHNPEDMFHIEKCVCFSVRVCVSEWS